MPKDFNPRIYGGYAQATCLADYFEWQAWRGNPLNYNDLKDQIGDGDWTQAAIPQITVDPIPEDPDDPAPTPDEQELLELATARVWALLTERCTILGDKYPYSVARSRLCRSTTLLTNYDTLMSVCLAHALDIRSGVNPRVLFEDVVAGYWSARGESCLVINKHRRKGHGKFEQCLRAAADETGVRLSALDAPRSRRAFDCGVDAAYVTSWPDNRPGRLTMLAQATVGATDTWYRKGKEHQEGTWKRILEASPISTLLSIPHHVEPETLKWLHTNDILVQDRLRLLLRYPTELPRVVQTRTQKLVAKVYEHDPLQ